MADTPEYKRQTPIQPAQAVTGFAQAGHAFGASSGIIGKYGADLAQRAANKNAALNGIEAAKQGKPILPIQFTAADKAYEEAYTHEITNNLAFQGNKLLSQLQYTASKVPTAGALNDFQAHGMQGIESLVDKAPKQYQPDLRRSLESSLQSSFYQLANKVDSKDREYLSSQRLLQDNQQNEKITNSGLEGIGSEQALTDRLNTIDGREELYKNTGGMDGYDPATAEAQRKSAVQRFQMAMHQREYVDAQKEKKGSEYIANLRENKPKDMTPSQHDTLVKGVIGYANEYQAAFANQQSINVLKYATMVDMGQMTESSLLQAKQDVSEEQFAKLERYIATHNNKAMKATNLFNEASEHLDNGVFMSKYSGPELDSIFSEKLRLTQQSKEDGEEISVIDVANAAKMIHAPVPIVNKQVTEGIKSTNPAVSYQYAKILDSLDASNRRAIENVGSDAKIMANKMLQSVRNGVSIPEAHAIAMESMSKITDTVRKERGNDFDTYYKKEAREKRSGVESIENESQYVLESMGINNPGFFFRNVPLFSRETIKVPDGLRTSFMDIMKDFYVNGADFEQANEMAAKSLGRVWKISRSNGKSQLMWYAPELFGDMEDIKDDMYLQLDSAVKGIKNVMGDEFKVARAKNNELALGVEMTLGNGEKIKGSLMINSDQYSDKNDHGEVASYSVYVLPEGRRLPKLLTDSNGKQIRYRISEESLKRAREDRTKRKKELSLKYKETAAKVHQMRDESIWESVDDNI